MLMYSIGFTVNLNTLLLQPLMTSLGITKTEGSLIISVQNFSGVLSMILAGFIYSRYSIRKFSFAFGLLIASGYLMFSFATTVHLCYIASALIGIGYGGSSLIPVSTLLNRWFFKKKGLAVGLASLGTGIATIIFSLIIALTLTYHGLKSTYLLMFTTVLIFSLLAFLLVRDFPKSVGLLRYGAAEHDRIEYEIENVDSDKTFVFDILKNSSIYFVSFSMFLIGLTMTSTISHIGPHLQDLGYGSIFVSTMLTIYGATMILFKPLYGLISDNVGCYWSNFYIYFLWILALACAFLVPKSIFFAIGFAIFCGAGAPLGNMAPIFIVNDTFTSTQYTQAFTISRVLFTLGGSIGAIFPGIIADHLGHYTPVFPIFIGITVLSLLILQIHLYIRGNRRRY